MPVGRVKWFDPEKGFGFVVSDEGQEVFLPVRALPEGVKDVKAGTRLEFGVLDGRRGLQALGATILEEGPSATKAQRRPAQEMAVLVEDLIKLLDSAGNSLRRGKYPTGGQAKKVAQVLRRVADDLDA